MGPFDTIVSCSKPPDMVSLVSLLIIELINVQKTIAGEGLTAYSFLFGIGSDDVQHISFQPEDGLRYRKKYEAKHGPRGRFLIEKLGQGYSVDGPSALDPDLLTKSSKKKSKRSRTKANHAQIPETTTAILSTTTTELDTTIYDSTTNTVYYDSTSNTEEIYDSTTPAESFTY
ncbi:uncharacterized protein LOC142321251 [Lycorma delicatula]|uniref:uncharacterized protein LOC142321251 n=1 Tax=Lycorma delicatula TaxID=130591 RepID=UPI003F51387E